MKNAIALIRVSTEAQAQEDRAGLASQRRECQRIAEREGLAIVEWVELAGVSGAKVMQDRRFLALLDRIGRGEIGAVIASAWDRIMRPANAADYLILDVLRDSGTLVYTNAGVRDVRNDRLLTVLEGEIAHLEKMHIRRRTMEGRRTLRRQGKHPDAARCLPYGIGYDRPAARWFYKPAEAEQVRAVFAAVLGGARDFSALARELGLTRTLVGKILRQPLYAGFRRLDASGRVAAEGEEQAIFEAPLVERSKWEAAHAIAAARQPAPRGEGPGLFRGFLRCAHCGRSMHFHTERHRSATYRCSSLAGAVQIAQPAVDAAADAAVGGRLAQPDVLLAALESAHSDTPAALQSERLEAESKRLREERERVALAFERGLRTLPDAERRFREIDAHLARLARAAEPEPERPDPAELAVRLAAPFAEWPYLSTSQKRRILAAAVEWVRVARTGRAQATVEAIRLRIPTDPAPAPSRGPRRAAWGVWGGSLEVALWS